MFNAIMKIFGYPFGWLMWAMYHLVSNYGVALLLFTLVVKLLLFPLALKQQKTTVKMQLFQPKVQEIQSKYKNNPNKMNEELAALYEKEGYSPMSGCWPTLIQFPVIFGLLDVVYRPLTHLLRFSGETIDTLTKITEGLGVKLSAYAPQITIYQHAMAHPADYASVGADIFTKLESLNMNFLGMDLSQTPNLPWKEGGWNLLILIPILSGVTALLTSVITTRQNPQSGAAGGGMKIMMYLMPLMSLYFTFLVPAGVGIYWTLSNVFSIIQMLVLNKIYNPKEIAEKIKAEQEERAKRERAERIEARKRAKEAAKNGKPVGDTTYLSDKEKIKEARRRYAERYGDKYEDD